MAEVLLSTLADALGGPVVADATFTATASRARAVGDGVVANKTITVPVVQGVPSEPILLDHSGVDWCWRLRVVFPSIGVRIDRTVAVPDVPSVEWADLVDVDPATLLPAESAVPAWTAAVGQVAAILADTAVARDGAVVAQGASEEARDQAQVYAANTVELQDTTFTALIADPESETRAQLNATIAETLIPRDTLNILDFEVRTGTATSQTAAIKAALDANPGRAFYFPPGDYRLDTPLVVSEGNSLVLAEDARIYAGAAMDILINYAPELPGWEYAEDTAIVGGILDGALNAGTILSSGHVLRQRIANITFRDGIHRGLVTRSPGAEIIAYDLRFANTTDTNVADNVAIWAGMGDSHFRDIVIRDWTVGVVDKNANRWDRVHPWVGPDGLVQQQMTKRFPTSVGFDFTGASDAVSCLADTMRTGFKFGKNAGAPYTPPPRLLNCRVTYVDPPTLPAGIAAANPSTALDNASEVGAVIDRLTVKGNNAVNAGFLTGPATLLTVRNTFSDGFVNNVADYANGVKQETRKDFLPTIIGTVVPGAAVYSVQQGRMAVRERHAIYSFRIVATLDDVVDGSLSLTLPMPEGVISIGTGGGAIGEALGVPVAGITAFGGSTPNTRLVRRSASWMLENIPAVTYRNTAVTISGQITLFF